MLASPRVTALAALIVSFSFLSTARGDMAARWFDEKPCTTLEIRKHRSISKHEIVREVKIDDGAYVARVVAALEKLPTDGKMMIKMGPDASYTELVFGCGGAPRTVKIYQGMIQTPGTGFDAPTSDGEARLVRDLGALLAPAVGKVIPKVQGLRLAFKGFALTYAGGTSYDGGPGGPTVHAEVERFVLEVGRKPATTIEVASGQTPPAPTKLGRTGRTLVTYETRLGERLYPTHLQVR
jgi:hypothetical protein